MKQPPLSHSPTPAGPPRPVGSPLSAASSRAPASPTQLEASDSDPADGGAADPAPVLAAPLVAIAGGVASAAMGLEAAGRDDLSVCSTIDLLERAKGGNDAAWEIVFRRCVRGLRRFAVGRLPAQCRGMNDTEDLVQDTVIRALNHLDHFEFRHEGALLAYLRQSLLNRIVDEVRKTNRRPIAVSLPDDQVDHGQSPLEAAIGRQNVERYETALARLKARDREAIVLRLEQQVGYEDLAIQLGMPSSNAARVAVKRALFRLAHEMAAEDARPRGES